MFVPCTTLLVPSVILVDFGIGRVALTTGGDSLGMANKVAFLSRVTIDASEGELALKHLQSTVLLEKIVVAVPGRQSRLNPPKPLTVSTVGGAAKVCFEHPAYVYVVLSVCHVSFSSTHQPATSVLL